MKLTKPLAHSDDARHQSERNTYLAHCSNIASIIAAGNGLKVTALQDFIDLYLTSVNTQTES